MSQFKSLIRNPSPQFRYSDPSDWVKIGEGSFGVVFLSQVLEKTGPSRTATPSVPDVETEDKIPRKLVAIKRVPDDKFEWSELRRMQVLQGHSRHCVELIDFWESQGFVFLVMEPLKKFDSRREPIEKVQQVLRETLECLISIHKQGLIHGDIKPSNIMISESGITKIIDWDDTTFDPLYTKSEDPEMRKKIPQRDLYAFASTAFEMLVGFSVDHRRLSIPTRLSPKQQDFLQQAFRAANLKGDEYSAAVQTLVTHPFLLPNQSKTP